MASGAPRTGLYGSRTVPAIRPATKYAPCVIQRSEGEGRNLSSAGGGSGIAAEVTASADPATSPSPIFAHIFWRMLDSPPIEAPSSPTAKLLWTSGPREAIEWFFTAISLTVLWGTMVAGTFAGISAASKSALGYIILVGVGLIGLPIALSVTWPVLRSREQRVSIDENSETICFENVYLHMGFHLPRKERFFNCPFLDILWVQFLASHRGGPDWLVVSTTQGRIFLTSYSDNLAALSAGLSPLARSGKPPLTQSASMPAVIASTIVFGSLIIAFAMGWLP